MCASWGPYGLFAGRAGTALTAEIGLMKAGEQLAAMEMMAVSSVRRILALGAGVITMLLLAAVFSAVGVIGGWVVGVLLIGGGWRGADARRRDWWYDLANGVLKKPGVWLCGQFYCAVPGLYCQAHARGRVPRDDAHRGGGPLAVLGLDFLLTASMFSI